MPLSPLCFVYVAYSEKIYVHADVRLDGLAPSDAITALDSIAAAVADDGRRQGRVRLASGVGSGGGASGEAGPDLAARLAGMSRADKARLVRLALAAAANPDAAARQLAAMEASRE